MDDDDDDSPPRNGHRRWRKSTGKLPVGAVPKKKTVVPPKGKNRKTTGPYRPSAVVNLKPAPEVINLISDEEDEVDGNHKGNGQSDNDPRKESAPQKSPFLTRSCSDQLASPEVPKLKTSTFRPSTPVKKQTTEERVFRRSPVPERFLNSRRYVKDAATSSSSNVETPTAPTPVQKTRKRPTLYDLSPDNSMSDSREFQLRSPQPKTVLPRTPEKQKPKFDYPNSPPPAPKKRKREFDPSLLPSKRACREVVRREKTPVVSSDSSGSSISSLQFKQRKVSISNSSSSPLFVPEAPAQANYHARSGFSPEVNTSVPSNPSCSPPTPRRAPLPPRSARTAAAGQIRRVSRQLRRWKRADHQSDDIDEAALLAGTSSVTSIPNRTRVHGPTNIDALDEATLLAGISSVTSTIPDRTHVHGSTNANQEFLQWTREKMKGDREVVRNLGLGDGVAKSATRLPSKVEYERARKTMYTGFNPVCGVGGLWDGDEEDREEE